LGERHDLWSINVDEEYHEEIHHQEKKTPEETIQEKITHIFPRLDPVALGISVGITAGVAIFAATLFLVIRDGLTDGPNLALISNFLPGYTITLWGSVVGLFGLFIFGFFFGLLFAYLRNVAVFISARAIHRDIELYQLRRLFDFI
jgi:hypothetical protein